MLNKIKLFFSNKTKVLILSTIISICLSISLYLYLISPPNNLEVIPKETQAILVIDPVSIFQKGRFQETLNIKGIKNIKDKSEENKLIKKIQKDLNYTGINITSDIFGYLLIDNDNEAYTCLALSIKCAKNFENSFTDILSEIPDLFNVKSNDLIFKIKKEKNFKYAISRNNRIAVAWDSKKAVIIRPIFEQKFLEKKVKKLMTLKEKDQITHSKEFNDFYSKKGEISFWMSTEHVHKDIISKDGQIQKIISDYNEIKDEVLDPEILTLLKSYEDKFISILKNSFKNNYISMFLSFEENYISFRMSSKLNSSMQKLVSNYNILNNQFNGELLDYFPNQNWFLSTTSLNQKKYLPIINNFFNFLEKVLGPDYKTLLPFSTNPELLKAFNESIIFTFHGFDNIRIRKKDYKIIDNGFDFDIQEFYKFENMKSPLFSSALDINNKNEIINYLDTSKKTLEYNNGYYTKYLLNKIPVYFNINNNNILFLTNDTSKILQFISGEEINLNASIDNSKITNKIKKNLVYGKLDIPESFNIIGKYLQLTINENIKKTEDILNDLTYNSNNKRETKKSLKKLENIKNAFSVLEEELNKFALKTGESIEYEFIDVNTFEIRINTPENGKNSLNNLSLALVEAFIYFETFKSIVN